MKRKIEKYLSTSGKKLKREDGRYDFRGDMDGVLSAVRENDNNRSSSRKSSSSATSTTTIKKTSSRRAKIVSESTTAVGSLKNSTVTPRLKGATAGKSTKLTATFDDGTLFNESSSTQTNSVSKALFGKTPSRKSEDVELNSSNIFSSPRSALKSNKVNTSDKRELRTTFLSGRASIMDTPQVSKKTDLLSINTPDNIESIQGFTPLSMAGTKGGNGQFDEILGAEGLFSPGELFADVGNNYSEGVKTPKTPHASNNPRMCIANVRFGNTPKTTDMKQRHVAISPIGSMQSVQQNKKKRRSLFELIHESEKKQRKDGTMSAPGMGMVTPSFSISSSTAVTTYPLTVCSSAVSRGTLMTLEELSKIKPIPINSTLQKDSSTLNHQGMEPKLIQSHGDIQSENLSPMKTMKGYASVEKFWTSVGNLDHLTPFRSDAPSSSAALNSKYTS